MPRTNRDVVLLVCSLLASALCVFFIVSLLPVDSHADDWPGPGVGAAICLEGGGVMAFLAGLLAVSAWRPPTASMLAWIALIASGLEFFVLGLLFCFVGLEPFCGQTFALAGTSGEKLAKIEEPLLIVQLFSSGCGLAMTAEYVVPLLILVALVRWRMRASTNAIVPEAS